MFGTPNGPVSDMCYDHSRRLLFMLIENEGEGSSIEGFWLGDQGQGLTNFCTMTNAEIQRAINRCHSGSGIADQVAHNPCHERD